LFTKYSLKSFVLFFISVDLNQLLSTYEFIAQVISSLLRNEMGVGTHVEYLKEYYMNC